jgi:hypothetical protein
MMMMMMMIHIDASGEGGYGAFVKLFDIYRKARAECKGPVITHCR